MAILNLNAFLTPLNEAILRGNQDWSRYPIQRPVIGFTDDNSSIMLPNIMSSIEDLRHI